jgi:hypothetical protein
MVRWGVLHCAVSSHLTCLPSAERFPSVLAILLVWLLVVAHEGVQVLGPH